MASSQTGKGLGALIESGELSLVVVAALTFVVVLAAGFGVGVALIVDLTDF